MTPQNGKISFKAPSDPGSYEFVMYQFGLGKEMLGLPMVDNSFRMTIVVEWSSFILQINGITLK